MDITALSHHSVSVVARHLGAGTADPAFADVLRWAAGEPVQQRQYVTPANSGGTRPRTVGWLLAAVMLVAGVIVTVIAVSGSDDPPDPATIGTDPGEAGIRALASRLDSGQIRGGNSTGEAFTPDECAQDMRARFDRLPAEYTEQSGDLAVERVGRGDDGDFGKVFGLGLREDDAGAILVNRDPAASCHGWELILLRQNGRWMVDLASFTGKYVDPGGADGFNCDISL